MSGLKFSQFTAGGNPIPGDQFVGLRAGVNTIFNATGYVNQTTSPVTMARNAIYINNSGVALQATLPAVAQVGDVFGVLGGDAFRVYPAAGQSLYFGSAATVTVGHFLGLSTTVGGLLIMCTTANVNFVVYAHSGNFVSV